MIVGAGLAMLAALGGLGTPSSSEIAPYVSPAESKQGRRKNKTAKALARFYGYASDRKGKGQKKREASARHVRGWK